MAEVVEMPVPAGMKRCGAAIHEGERVQSVANFYRARHSKDGLQGACKVCTAKQAALRGLPRSEVRIAPGPDGPAEDVDEEEAEPEEKDDVERWWRFRMWHAYELAGGRIIGVTRNGDHQVDDLEIRRWANEVAAELRAGKPIDEAIRIANLDHELLDEDLPVGVERSASARRAPRPLEGLTERPQLAQVKLERDDHFAKHRLRGALVRHDGRSAQEAAAMQREHRRPATAAKVEQCRGCAHDAHPAGRCPYGIGALFGQCVCERSTSRKVSKWRRELQERVAAKGHGAGAPPADPFDCMPLGLELLRTDRAQKEAADLSRQRAERWASPDLSPLDAELLAELARRGGAQAYDLQGEGARDVDLDVIRGALRRLEKAGRVEHRGAGKVVLWRVVRPEFAKGAPS